MRKELSHSIRISQSTFLKLWDYQLELMHREGKKTSLQTLIEISIDKLLETEKGS